MIRRIVDRQRVFLTVEAEGPLGNSIAYPPRSASKILVAFAFVTGHVVKAQHHVGRISILVRRVQFNQCGSTRHHFHLHPGIIMQRVEFYRMAVPRLSERYGLGNFSKS